MAQRGTTPGFRDDRYKALIAALVDRRRELGISQSALGEQLGLHKQFVSRYELGERRLDAVEYADVARALGLEPGELLNRVTVSARAAETS